MNDTDLSEVMERLWRLVEKRDDGCWIWTGAAVRGRYGVIRRPHQRRNILTHVAVHLAAVGPIPDGYQVDHLCRVTLCCNPAHLEAVTQAENLRRQTLAKTHCKRGHEFTPENTYVPPNGPCKRKCRKCVLFTAQQRRAAA